MRYREKPWPANGTGKGAVAGARAASARAASARAAMSAGSKTMGKSMGGQEEEVPTGVRAPVLELGIGTDEGNGVHTLERARREVGRIQQAMHQLVRETGVECLFITDLSTLGGQWNEVHMAPPQHNRLARIVYTHPACLALRVDLMQMEEKYGDDGILMKTNAFRYDDDAYAAGKAGGGGAELRTHQVGPGVTEVSAIGEALD